MLSAHPSPSLRHWHSPMKARHPDPDQPGSAAAWRSTARVIELIGRQIVAEQVAAVVGEPQGFTLRMPVEANAIAHAVGINFSVTSVGIQALDVGVTAGVRLANIARRADWDVKLAVRAEGDELPTMVRIAGKSVADDNRFRRIVEPQRTDAGAGVKTDGRHLTGAQRADKERATTVVVRAEHHLPGVVFAVRSRR